jgi:hypothetical protein
MPIPAVRIAANDRARTSSFWLPPVRCEQIPYGEAADATIAIAQSMANKAKRVGFDICASMWFVFGRYYTKTTDRKFADIELFILQ